MPSRLGACSCRSRSTDVSDRSASHQRGPETASAPALGKSCKKASTRCHRDKSGRCHGTSTPSDCWKAISAALRTGTAAPRRQLHLGYQPFVETSHRAISCRQPSQTRHRWAAIPSDPSPLLRACRIVKRNVWPHLTMHANGNPLDQRSHTRCISQWQLSTGRAPSNRSSHLCLRSDRYFLPAPWDSRSVRGSERMQPR